MRKTLGVVSINGRAIRVILQLFSIAGIFLIVRETAAIPQYARQTGNSCARCHIVAPKLSLDGEEFLAKGYRFEDETASDDTAKSLLSHIPLSVWITTRHEEQLSRDFSETYLPKVELISGGPIAKLPLSYFVEWRIVSQQTRNDGTLLDRGGRFEDVILNWQINDRHALRVGQFRALN